MPDSDRPRVHVDFNEMDPQGRFFVLPEDVEDGALGLRSAVVLVDEEGNSARGQVTELMEQGRAIVAMLAGSWQSDAPSVPVPQDSRSFQELVTGLLAASVQRKRSAPDWYRLSVIPSNIVTATATPPSGLPEPRGAVPSTL
jgi:hypothetical protein